MVASTDDELICAQSQRDVSVNRPNDLVDLVEAYEQAAMRASKPSLRPTFLEYTQWGSD